MNEVVADRMAQRQELDPAAQAAIREYIEKASPEEKAFFLGLSPEDQNDFLDDPDKHDRILGRKP